MLTAKQPPTAAQVLQARERAGLTQAQAAQLVHLHRSMTWSEYERGVRPIDPARWELFLLLTQQHPSVPKKKHVG